MPAAMRGSMGGLAAALTGRLGLVSRPLAGGGAAVAHAQV
jgi:hypothetical protein